jgi:hypothetical protein
MVGIQGRLVYLVCNCHVTGNMRRYKYWPISPFPPTVGDLTQVKQSYFCFVLFFFFCSESQYLFLLSHESFILHQQVSDLCVWTNGITQSG